MRPGTGLASTVSPAGSTNTRTDADAAAGAAADLGGLGAALAAPAARQAIEEVAAKLADRFGLQSTWRGDVLDFSGSGVDGAIELQPTAVRVTAKLGFRLSAL